jgi:serine/threonine protein kinase
MKGKNEGKLNKNIDKYELMENIGQGQYGNVYKAKLQNAE